jgi:ABC-type Fe3+-hydroxamate transport system substrate-binding protein
LIAVVGLAKTPADQVQETDKLLADALDKLEQARRALQSLQDRLRQQEAEERRPG